MGKRVLRAGWLAVAMLAPGAWGADLKTNIPQLCQCSTYIATTAEDVHFTYRDPAGRFPLEGWCDYEMYLFNEQYCPKERGCIPHIIGKDIKRLERTVVDTRPQCSRTLFRPYINPFLDRSTLAFGPFRPSETVKHYFTHWFSGNITSAQLTGISFLQVGSDRLGRNFYGTVSTGQAPGDLPATMTVANARGTVALSLTVRVVK
jgi:hypothetical protein